VLLPFLKDFSYIDGVNQTLSSLEICCIRWSAKTLWSDLEQIQKKIVLLFIHWGRSCESLSSAMLIHLKVLDCTIVVSLTLLKIFNVAIETLTLIFPRCLVVDLLANTQNVTFLSVSCVCIAIGKPSCAAELTGVSKQHVRFDCRVNRRPYNLYCVGGDVKPCSINQSILTVEATVKSAWKSIKSWQCGWCTEDTRCQLHRLCVNVAWNWLNCSWSSETTGSMAV